MKIKIYEAVEMERRALGLYNYEMAEKLYMHPITYYRKKCGKISYTITELLNICRLFNWTMEMLLGLEE